MKTGGIEKLDIDLSGSEGDFVIVASRWNDDIVLKLVEGAINELSLQGIDEKKIRLIRVPGAFEIPLICQQVINMGGVAAVLALGVIIRGDTPHFEHVANGCTNGIIQVSLKTEIPISNGVLTVNSVEQALERSNCDGDNKGAEAALVALEMVHLLKYQAY